MTTDQKIKMEQMRIEGQSYLKIASTLGISINTVKSYFRRNNFTSYKKNNIKGSGGGKTNEIYNLCKHCGNILMAGTIGHPKKFCSESCRRTWWKSNNEQSAKKAWYTLICTGCKKEFKSYGNKSRKYCSHACYINKRYKKGSDEHD